MEPSALSPRVVVPGRFGSVELRPHADGADLVGSTLSAGPAEEPAALLGGALYVTVRRDGDEVVWDGWRNPVRDEVELPAIRFDAARYAAELARAAADRSWEWPARTVARLLEADLRAAPDRLARWACEAGRRRGAAGRA